MIFIWCTDIELKSDMQKYRLQSSKVLFIFPGGSTDPFNVVILNTEMLWLTYWLTLIWVGLFYNLSSGMVCNYVYTCTICAVVFPDSGRVDTAVWMQYLDAN